MKIPRKVTIKGKEWRIMWRKRILDDFGNECHGLCVSSQRKILLEKGMNRKQQKVVFLHELNHAILYECHVDLASDIEEIVVQGLAQVYAELFQLSRLPALQPS